MKYVMLLGEFTPTFEPHRATMAALRHACDALDIELAGEWVSTADAEPAQFSRYSGLWVVPGSPYKNLVRTLDMIKCARERRIPCFGTCGGFQHMVLEYARNVLKFTDAQHAEYDPYASNLFISQLSCSLAGRELVLRFVKGSRVASIYRDTRAVEEYYCNFGVNPAIVRVLNSASLRITGSDDEGEVRVIELPDHPFFIGTLFVPQTRSRPEHPHPLVNAFVRAVESDGAAWIRWLDG
jgi:CTP synthase (UTP-ammonia lyase)